MEELLHRFCYDLELGREVELHLNNTFYFIHWNQTLQGFEVFDETQKRVVFRGNMEELLSFPFQKKYMLKDSFCLFSVDYVL